MPTQYDALAGKESDECEDIAVQNVRSYEDLSITRIDEETVLNAVYADEFSTKEGPWGSRILCVKVQPLDTEPSKIGSQLTLNIAPGKKYPCLPPAVEFEDVKGLGNSEQVELMQQLNARCKELAAIGSVMVCELVQVTEDFLYCHNKDPTMSAYDQMMAREEEERKMKMETEKKLHSFMNVTDEISSPSKSRIKGYSEHSRGVREPDAVEHDRIEKELDRQQAALTRAIDEENADGNNSLANDVDDSFEDDDDDDDDDDDYQFDEPAGMKGSGSRYESDFTEKGLLGRGGGGTVFKVRNRLDRRIYAVKKIPLMSEHGNMQQIGKLENIKLRREVTTISKMTHRHIVRYYQAWVEGGVREDTLDKSMKQSDEERLHHSSMNDSASPSNDEDTLSQIGFWGQIPSSNTNFGSFDDSDSNSEWSSSSNAESISPPAKNVLNPFDTDDDSVPPGDSNINGLGFEKHQSYSDLFKRNRKESIASSDDLDFQLSIMDQISSQNIKGSSSIMYIQMEFCSTTLRQLIDERKLEKMEKNERWKMIRQTLEALAYIHKKKIIHRDLKPDNIFLDSEHNIRLGDFGLATTRHKKVEILPNQSVDETSDKPNKSKVANDSIHDTITGGVGTPFYIAPEQACHKHHRGKGQTDYDMKADVFSLGIIIFEMFNPFSTKMERATTLQQLRGDGQTLARYPTEHQVSSTSFTETETARTIVESKEWKVYAARRFPHTFCNNASPEIQKLILWCLEHSPENRPSAEQLLSSDLLPRQMELDHCYLKEALHTIANPESESNEQIIKALFNRHALQHVEITYDTDDIAIIKRNFRINSSKNATKRFIHPIKLLGKSLDQIGGFTSGDMQGIRSPAMNFLSMSAAMSTLRRAKGAGKIAKGEELRNAIQHAATVLAMNSATGAAVSGHIDGVNGADPRVIKSICDHFSYIFESHGAILLSPPLLRPKGQADITRSSEHINLSHPAEVLNERGNNLVLPEDLQVNFARTVGRGGGALSNVKRYCIGKSYLNSISGGHPREILEASFDIILEDHASKNEYFTAEVIMVICQALHILSPRAGSNLYGLNTGVFRPIWFLRLTHTRLADAILDLCGVPPKEPMRRACYHILTCCSAPPPCLLKTVSTNGKTLRGKSYAKRVNPKKVLSRLIEVAISEYDLPKIAAAKLRAFLNSGCLPLPLNVNEALDALQNGAKKLRSMDDQRYAMPKRQKRYEDVARGLRSVRNCINAMDAMGIDANGNESEKGDTNHHPPAFISLDLGMRQSSHHYHGHLYFQAIMLTEDPDSVISNDTLLSGEGKGIKIAEGGRYDDLVRRFRPPGNFGASQMDEYTSAPIPVCTGVRFMVGSFVERVYVQAALESRIEAEQISTLTTESETLRRALAIPSLSKASIQCIVVSMNGFDSTSIPERAMVASHLWVKDISAEYIPHSGVMLSLLRKIGGDSMVSDTAEWTVDQLCDLCCILRIPFVVVVQQHLLRERKSVRLRHTIDNNGVHEIFVPLASLASEIKDRLSGTSRTNEDFETSIPNSPFDRQSHDHSSGRLRSMSAVSPDLEYIYVDTDQFYLNLDKVSGKDPKLKPLLKMMKKTQLKADPYVKEELHNILAVDLPFPIVREFNSEAMLSNGPSIANSTIDLITKYAKYRKTLKSYAMCLDFLLRRCEETNAKASNGSGTRQKIMSILVYAQPDDRFDLLTLEISSGTNGKVNDSQHNTFRSSRRDRNGRR